MSGLVKYPRTYHVPWSPGAKNDDRMLSDSDVKSMFFGREVLVTEKLDGENTTIYADGTCHARSLDSGRHLGRDYVRGLARRIGYLGLPRDLRLFGENLFARHSIGYDRLPDFFVIFGGAFDSRALSWAEVEEWGALCGVPLAPVVYRGTYDEKKIRALYPAPSRFGSEGSEGYVIRIVEGFAMDEFENSVAKFVRKDHVETDEHWMHTRIQPNRLSPRV